MHCNRQCRGTPKCKSVESSLLPAHQELWLPCSALSLKHLFRVTMSSQDHILAHVPAGSLSSCSWSSLIVPPAQGMPARVGFTSQPWQDVRITTFCLLSSTYSEESVESLSAYYCCCSTCRQACIVILGAATAACRSTSARGAASSGLGHSQGLKWAHLLLAHKDQESTVGQAYLMTRTAVPLLHALFTCI